MIYFDFGSILVQKNNEKKNPNESKYFSTRK